MSEPRYWLVVRDMPTGPFTVAEVHAMLASGDVTWDAQAAQVGSTDWRPLLRTPGIGPGTAAAIVESVATDVKVSEAASSNQEKQKPKRDKVPEPAGLNKPVRLIPLLGAVLAIAVVVIGLYEVFRSLSPLEVCQRLEGCQTAAEAKAYATPRMYPLLDKLFADKTPQNPNDTFSFTGEVAGQTPGTRWVGYRGSFLDDSSGRRVAMEGHFTLVQKDGWKIDDIFITAMEGTTIPAPVSMFDVLMPGGVEKSMSPRPKSAASSLASTPTPSDPRSWIERNKLLCLIGMGLLLGLHRTLKSRS